MVVLVAEDAVVMSMDGNIDRDGDGNKPEAGRRRQVVERRMDGLQQLQRGDPGVGLGCGGKRWWSSLPKTMEL